MSCWNLHLWTKVLHALLNSWKNPSIIFHNIFLCFSCFWSFLKNGLMLDSKVFVSQECCDVFLLPPQINLILQFGPSVLIQLLSLTSKTSSWQLWDQSRLKGLIQQLNFTSNSLISVCFIQIYVSERSYNNLNPVICGLTPVRWWNQSWVSVCGTPWLVGLTCEAR